MNEKAKCKNCTDEMIEEMAFDLIKATSPLGVKDLTEVFNYEKVATALYNAGYRKIPDGSVVLTSEQYSNYLILQTNHEFIRERAKELQADNERLYKNLSKFKESVRKETAKEIFYKLKETLIINNEENTEFFDYSYTLETIDEIAKQFGVEVEE